MVLPGNDLEAMAPWYDYFNTWKLQVIYADQPVFNRVLQGYSTVRLNMRLLATPVNTSFLDF
jgi:hypothetical protein